MRILGAAMVIYGVAMLLMLNSPWRDWALDHSIAEVVSYSDRRANNQVSGSVDEPIAIAGSAVMVFAGLWFLFLVPWALNRNKQAMLEAAGLSDEPDQGP